MTLKERATLIVDSTPYLPQSVRWKRLWQIAFTQLCEAADDAMGAVGQLEKGEPRT